MYIIISGCGKIGSNLAISLEKKNGNKVVIIDSLEENFAKLQDRYTSGTVTGDCLDEAILREAGIEKATCIIGVTEDDNTNIMLAQIAREKFHVPIVISKIVDPTLARMYRLEEGGIFSTVCPTDLVVNQIIKTIEKASVETSSCSQ